MKYFSFLLLLTILFSQANSQLKYDELDDLNILCKKEDFEAAKTFLKNSGYIIYTDNESFDHGSYFVLAQIAAHIKLGELNDASYLKGTDLNNIYDDIKIEFDEYDDDKVLEISQSLFSNNPIDISNARKFDPLYQWLNQQWDNISVSLPNGKDSSWNRYDDKIDSESYRNYFFSKSFSEKDQFFLSFGNFLNKVGEKKLYYLRYDYDKEPYVNKSLLYITSDITLKTTIDKTQNVTKSDKIIFSFPLIKIGSSYLIKVRFGNLIKTYILDSGASDMTLDDETYQHLKITNQLKISNNLTSQEYILADGSKVEYKRIKIPTFSIGDINVNNINAVLVEDGKPLLLGKSFLDSFKSWKVDNKNNALIVEAFQ
jgi:hypothetical protein